MKGRMVTLIKREVWESRLLWVVPLLGAILMLAGVMFGDLYAPRNPVPDPAYIAIDMLRGAMSCVVGASILVAGIYLADCLYGERKDRSILFWKSLPVSDRLTVVSKLVVAMGVLPLGALLLALITHGIAIGILGVRMDGLPGTMTQVFSGRWLEAAGRFTTFTLFVVLWYLPVAAYLMLASVLAKKVPFAYAALPLFVAVTFERMVFLSEHVMDFLRIRLAPWEGSGRHILDPSGDVLKSFSDPQLWMGLAVTCGMLYIVIRLRRYRDDT